MMVGFDAVISDSKQLTMLIQNITINWMRRNGALGMKKHGGTGFYSGGIIATLVLQSSFAG
jgi:hypothetical protein